MIDPPAGGAPAGLCVTTRGRQHAPSCVQAPSGWNSLLACRNAPSTQEPGNPGCLLPTAPTKEKAVSEETKESKSREKLKLTKVSTTWTWQHPPHPACQKNLDEKLLLCACVPTCHLFFKDMQIISPISIIRFNKDKITFQ